uniref:Uncharacterized protein n=1 Tax=Plectus sambesii TaxID=2011161 RepID=A0A914UWJ5_9BILA
MRPMRAHASSGKAHLIVVIARGGAACVHRVAPIGRAWLPSAALGDGRLFRLLLRPLASTANRDSKWAVSHYATDCCLSVLKRRRRPSTAIAPGALTSIRRRRCGRSRRMARLPNSPTSTGSRSARFRKQLRDLGDMFVELLFRRRPHSANSNTRSAKSWHAGFYVEHNNNLLPSKAACMSAYGLMLDCAKDWPFIDDDDIDEYLEVY